MKPIILMAVIVLAIGAAAIYYINRPDSFLNTTPTASDQVFKKESPESSGLINKQASFAIFTNGTFRVFTASMYHNLSEDVFIESSNPNIVRVKKAGVTWDDFFKTLPFKLSKDCLTTGTGQTSCTGQNGTLKFYLNGQLEPKTLDKVINQGDKLLISFGNETEPQIQTQLEKIPDPNP